MRTLALRGGARVTVVEADWCHAFGVVTRGRVQLELRDGEPGPVLGRDAGFWLRGTGVRALRNPGRRTARVRPAERFMWTAVSLTAISLILPRGRKDVRGFES